MNTIDITNIGPKLLEVLLVNLAPLSFPVIKAIMGIVKDMDDDCAAQTAYAIANDCIESSDPRVAMVLCWIRKGL